MGDWGWDESVDVIVDGNKEYFEDKFKGTLDG